MTALPTILAMRIRLKLLLWRLLAARPAWRTIRRALERMAPAG